MIRREVSIIDERHPAAALTVTLYGDDRPGIVRRLSERAREFGASWTGSRMANLGGRFAGIVHFEVPAESADALSDALRRLQSTGLHVVVDKTVFPAGPAGRRLVLLEIQGPDRPGIVHEMSQSLADRGVSIEQLHTEVVGDASAQHTFKVRALLLAPETLSNAELRRGLESLTSEMKVDIDIGEQGAAR